MCNINKIKRLIYIFTIIIFVFVNIVFMSGAKKESDPEENPISLPIIMYHSLLSDRNLQNDYTIPPNLFENDLKFICNNKYTTITVEDLIDYVYADKALPSKPIMLTFDDGFYNNYYYAYPLLKKYKCKAVISPIISATERFTDCGDISITYGYISVDNIKEMVNSGLVEIQNHSYDMHKLKPRKGIAQKTGESTENYRREISQDIIKAQKYLETNANITAECFVYPFGAKSNNTFDIIKSLGFACTMTCTEKPNEITKNPNSLYELGRYRRDKNESMQELLNRYNRKKAG